jgi:hypothetical protein
MMSGKPASGDRCYEITTTKYPGPNQIQLSGVVSQVEFDTAEIRIRRHE